MTIHTLIANSRKILKTNSPEILTAVGIVGVVSTGILTAKATTHAIRVIDRYEDSGGIPGDNTERIKTRIRITWRYYIPPVTSGVLTIGCVLGAQRVNARRTAAAVTAYAVTERAFSEYKEKVVEQIGKGPAQKVTDKVAQDKVDANPASNNVVVLSGGHVLCCDLYTGRYFRSDKETIMRARNEVNERVFSERYAMMSEFYDLIGLPHTSQSDWIGWEGKEMELSFTSVLSEPGGEPCLAYDFNYVKPLR